MQNPWAVLDKPDATADDYRDALLTLRKSQIAQAKRALSYSEEDAMRAVFAELDGAVERTITVTRIAETLKLTRTSVTAALHKLNSGGIIQSRSLGAGGTHIKVLVPEFASALGESA